jgi:hypothetical protein
MIAMPDLEQVQQPFRPASVYLREMYDSSSSRRERVDYDFAFDEDVSFRAPDYAQVALNHLQSKFDSHASKWRDDTGGDSSLTNIIGNINYLKIIRMGDDALPFILRELQREPAPWFVALRVITDDDSVGRDTPGDFRAMAKAWLEWGRARGHI